MIVRPATADDKVGVIVCARFYDQVVTSDEHVGYLFDLALANEGMFVAVAELGVVGFACALVLPHPFGGFPYVDIVAVFVQPTHRNTWASVGLLRHLLRWCGTLPLDMVKMSAPVSSRLGTLLHRAGFRPAETIYLKGAAWLSRRC